MSAHTKCKQLWIAVAVPLALSCVVRPVFGQNQVLGEIDFHGASKVEKSSGVWIDGQYVGYLKELKGMKKILLLPGEHQISVRQTGYLDYSQRIIVEPGQTQSVRVTMQKEPGATMPSVTATLKVDILPTRAAVFAELPGAEVHSAAIALNLAWHRCTELSLALRFAP